MFGLLSGAGGPPGADLGLDHMASKLRAIDKTRPATGTVIMCVAINTRERKEMLRR
jgi:hypothetical protein